MIVQVVEGVAKQPDGKEVKVKILTAHDPASGLGVQIPMSVDQAKEIAAGLDGRKIVTAQPGDIATPSNGEPKQ